MSGKHYTEAEDAFLMVYGPAVGFNFVASHDLGRPYRSGSRRAAWLWKNRPEFVAECDRRAEEWPE